MTVNAHDRCIDHRVLHVWLVATGVEKLFENISFYPVSEPHEDRVPLAKRRRQIPPGTTGPRDPQNRFDEQPVIGPASAGVRWFA